MLFHPSVHTLVAKWRTEASLFRRYGQDGLAAIFDTHAADIEAALGTEEEPSYKLTEAVPLTGYSADYLGKLVRRGEIPNVGRKGAPRVRLSDCPRRTPGAERAPLTLPTASSPLHLVGRSKGQVVRAVVANS